MPRPRKVQDSEQINLRLSADTLKRADKLIEHVSKTQGGIASTRTDVLRGAIAIGLRQMELEKAAGR